MIYEIQKCLKPSTTDNAEYKKVATMTLEIWQSQNPGKLEIKSFEQVKFSHVEINNEYILGRFVVPIKHTKEYYKFLCYIEKEGVTFIDDTNNTTKILREIADHKIWQEPSLEGFLYTFFEQLIFNDLLYLEELENRLAKIENTVLNGTLSNFNHKIMSFKKEIAVWSKYYRQLMEIGFKLEENANGFFEDTRLFQMFNSHIKHLQDTTGFLREYSVQVREAYQTEVDIKQNKIMELLAVVTTIFLPLTLLVGWYGMNFEYMPELKWQYGYPVMIIISIIGVIVCVKWFKKKHYF